MTVPGLVVHLVIASESEDVKPVSDPRDRRWRTVESSAEWLPIGQRRLPRLPVPGLVVHLVICPEPEDVKPVGAPRNDNPSNVVLQYTGGR